MGEERDYEDYCQIMHAMRKSVIRMKILVYLFVCGEPRNIQQIMNVVGTWPSHVRGAMWGMGKRYKAESSLLARGLVARLSGDINSNVTTYTLTEKGRGYVLLICTIPEFNRRVRAIIEQFT
ncbi:helix-turn-helix domain-containing protein [Methanocella sp. MCL-LM]|uniref:helix-turn-helix domain-containing protein n=1 Tax=Methanocella sp. MCL-LM TaxID=3412035 RepID=UPI003C727567